MFLDLIHSAALLLAFCWLQSFILHRLNLNERINQIVSGILFGGICIVGMMMPITLSSGIIIDPRTVILSLSGVFFGPFVAAIAASIAALYRILFIGSTTALVPVFLILLSFLFGTSFYYLRRKKWLKTGPWQLLAFGFMLHATIGLVSLPLLSGLARQQILDTAGPIILAFSIATMLIGLLLQEAENRFNTAKALRLSEAQQRSIIDSIPDRLFVLDEEGRYVEVMTPSNHAKYSEVSELVGKTLHDVLQKEIADDALQEIKNTVTTQVPHTLRYEHPTKRGIRQFEAHAQPNAMTINGKRTVVVIVRDISEQHQHHVREQRLLNMQRALSKINEAIVRIKDETELFQLACKIAVEHGDAFMAFAGIKEQASDRIIPAAWHGIENPFFQNTAFSTNLDIPEGQGPAGIAFREKSPVLVRDVETDERMQYWRNNTRHLGIRSGVALPVFRGGEPYAVFVATCIEADAFDDETVALLKQMASSISFALDNFDRKALRQQAEADLRESESRFRQIVHEAPFPMLIHTDKGNVQLINEAWTKLTGYRQRDMSKRTRTVIKRLFKDQALDAMDDIRELLSGQHHVSNEYTLHRKNGAERVCIFESTLIGTFSDGSKAMITMAVDQTERRSAEKALKLTQFSVEQAAFPVMRVTREGRFHFVNDAACRTLGYSKEEFSRLSPSDINPSYSEENWQQNWQNLREQRHLQFEATNMTKDGREITVEVNSNYLEYDGEEYNCAFIRDVTERKKAEEIIWHQANYDSLTGLPNRRMFIDRLEQEIRKAARTNLPVAILFIDLDDFKSVNDAHGHIAGDELLKITSERLQACVRETDTVSRLSGDEFTVIMGDLLDRSPINRVCSQILKNLSRPFNLNGEITHISASIGITVYPDDATSIDELLVNADQAMYAAKQRGRQRYHYFTPSMQEAAQTRKQMIRHLRNALGTEQLYVAYQPIVELESGEIHKAEALLRWQHPVQGMINPAQFIPVAEETGMIHELGASVFQTAAEQAARWRKKHSPSFQISVNMSPLQFRSEGKNSKIWSDYLRNTDFEGASVVAEITESMLLDAGETVIGQLRALRAAQLEIAIDDFGTGYSSLSYLKKFDIDYIKIDRSFVSGLSADSEELALCEAIIVMAHKLDIKVIAEGVETPEQRDLLIEAGCDYAQGFLYSPPVPAKELEQLF